MARRSLIRVCSAIVLGFLLTPALTAQERFPDGKKIPGWFSQPRKAELKALGRQYVLTDYGVEADKPQVQTEAIQHVIDLAASKGGGVVVVPEGVFLSGALHFPQGTNLWVKGTLRGSDRVKDFPMATTRIEGQTCTYFPALINIDGVDGFVLGGPGVIDGNGTEFWREMKIRWAWKKDAANKDGQRPRLVYISNSANVTVQDLHLKDSPFWTQHAYRSHHLRFLDLTVTSPSSGEVVGYSTDAIGLDNCHDVLVKGCYMDVCDDGVVLKGGKGTWADKDPENGPNNDIIIEDCTFGQTHACLTLGSESVEDRNVILRRCVSEAAYTILHLKMRPDTPQHYEFVRVESVTGHSGSILRIRPWTQYFQMEKREDMPVSLCNDIVLKDIQVEARQTLDVDLSPQYELASITLEGQDVVAMLSGQADPEPAMAVPGALSAAQQDELRKKAYATVNYDESAIPPYTLEDPLRFADGRPVRSRKQWPERRKEILDLFQREMYGEMPASAPIFLETLEEGTTLAGFARRRQVRMWFREDHSGPHIDWLELIPAQVQGPCPIILLLNYTGNHELLDDKEILVTESWLRETPHKASSRTRGKFNQDGLDTVFPLSTLLARGYALVTACYCDISPDPDPLVEKDGAILQDTFAYTGVFDLWGTRDPERTDNTTALAAWAWGLMRGMDMVEQDPALDGKRVVLTGYSRLGKAALLAGAFDERFPVVVPIQSGGGGAPLAKRDYGEKIATEVSSFRHWYCRAYDKYADDTDSMPFDQHLLLSCVAPRALLVEGFDKPWFDTKGEFLALQAASPVWKFLGQKGLPEVAWPDDYDTSAIGPRIGYVRRDQGHGISALDWLWMLDFADGVFDK